MITRRRSTPVRRPRRSPSIRRLSGNPYFNKKKRGPGMLEDIRRLALIFGLPALTLAIFGYLIWGPWLTVKEVSVSGASKDTEATIRKIIDEQMAVSGFWPSNNIVLFDERQAIKTISESFFLDSLEISKQLPDRLELEVAEKTVRAALLTDQRFLGLDGSGFLIRELAADEIIELGELPPEFGEALAPELGAQAVTISDEEAVGEEAIDDFQPRYPIITLTERPNDQPKIEIADQLLPSANLKLIIQIHNQLQDKVGERPLWYRGRDSDSAAIEVVMRGGWSAHFSAESDFSTQASKLAIVLKDKVGDRRSQLEYVDLRYGERIFFKFKADPATEE